MNKREKYENGLLTVRFAGEKLSKCGVSIYDLGETLIAIQRIVHKAFLAKHDRLTKGAFPNREERPSLALQLGERKRMSDAFALVPVLTDPSVQESMKVLMQYVVSGVVGYYTGNVLDKIRGEKDNNKRIFIGSIYKEVASIVNRVETTGGVEAISLGSPVLERQTFVAFDRKTKDYLIALKDESYLGSYQEVKGRVYKFYPASKIVAIKRAGGATVSIFLNEDDFKKIRYSQKTKPLFIFKGHPVYKFGVETKTITEFEADEIEYVLEGS